MDEPKSPRLRTVEKARPPYPINQFPPDFAVKLAGELVYLLATKGVPDLEGTEFESIFARCIGGEWKPSNVGLDDVVLENTAWSAKTLKAGNPSKQTHVRLIAGRNSLVYSFGEKNDPKNDDPNALGPLVLDIWNERVSAIRQHYKHLRTVVLVKSEDLTEVAIFEFETRRFDPDDFFWEWNKNSNLCGFRKKTKEQHFTWQPHGSQFTIIEAVPQDALVLTIQSPPVLEREKVLETLGFSRDWVKISARDPRLFGFFSE